MEKQKGKAAAPPAAMDATERAERTQKLVLGRISSEDSVVCYMVDQLRRIINETDVVSKQLQQAEAQAKQARDRLLELRGMRNKYIQDIEAFDKTTAPAEAPVIEEQAPPEAPTIAEREPGPAEAAQDEAAA